MPTLLEVDVLFNAHLSALPHIDTYHIETHATIGTLDARAPLARN